MVLSVSDNTISASLARSTSSVIDDETVFTFSVIVLSASNALLVSTATALLTAVSGTYSSPVTGSFARMLPDVFNLTVADR